METVFGWLVTICLLIFLLAMFLAFLGWAFGLVRWSRSISYRKARELLRQPNPSLKAVDGCIDVLSPSKETAHVETVRRLMAKRDEVEERRHAAIARNLNGLTPRNPSPL